jgi:predicted ATPase
MNFDEYKWNWDAQSTQQSEYTYDDNQLQRLGPYSEISNLSKDLGTCIGQ